MLSTVVRRFIIAGCALAIVLTMFFKTAIHEITNPAWRKSQQTNASTSQNQPVITLHYHERRPYYMKSGEEVQGVVAGLVGRVFRFAEVPYQWQETPAKRQLDIIRSNDGTSCGLGWFKTAEREAFGKYSKAIYQDTPFVAVTRADNVLMQNILALDDLFAERRLTLLVKAGYSYGKLIDTKIKQHKPWQIETTADNRAILRMIEGHRADYCFMTREEASDLFRHAGFNTLNFSLVPFSEMPEGNKRYLICSKKVSDETIARINLAIDFLLEKDREVQ